MPDPEDDDEEEEEAYAQQREAIKHAMSQLPATPSSRAEPDKLSAPSGLYRLVAKAKTLDFSTLIEQRTRHQTRQASGGLRTSKQAREPENSDASNTQSLRQQVIVGIEAVVRAEDTITDVSTGGERLVRWNMPGAGRHRITGDEGTAKSNPATGNKANAAVVAKIASNAVGPIQIPLPHGI